MKQLVIATQNRNKFSEMEEALRGVGWELLPAYHFPQIPEIIEDGKTLEENSLKKAALVSKFTGLPALSDDTGLYIEALNGEPGIYAARFAGENCTYNDNVKKVLGLMRETPKNNRKAIFRTVITLFFPTGEIEQVFGEVKGEITTEPRGAGGFGYDPIFQPEPMGVVFAEMSVSEKNKISHRGKALRKARELLEKK